MPDTTALTTGEFSRRSGLTTKALRLYDDSGLLRPVFVDPATGYRYYGPGQLRRARLVALLRRVGMSLTDIARLLDHPPADAEQRLRGWWAEREVEAVERRAAVDYLAHLLSTPSEVESEARSVADVGDPHPDFSIDVRTDPPLKVAAIVTQVGQDELRATIVASAIELSRHVEQAGATPGDELHVLYRGVVSPDDDGEVEVCLPFTGSVEPSDQILVRVEPARTLASTPVTAAQCRYPQILDAYDAVGRWVQDRATPVGSAREIYPFPRPPSVSDVVCLVAQPFRRSS